MFRVLATCMRQAISRQKLLFDDEILLVFNYFENNS